MDGTPQRLRDAQGHDWPVTGFWCKACGMPLHSMLRDAGVHPNCDVQQPDPAAAAGNSMEAEDSDG